MEDEKSCKLIASEVQPLSGICVRNAKIIKISACLSGLSMVSAIQLHTLLDRNPGNTGVDVELYYPSDFRVSIRSSDFVKVKSSTELFEQIENICGQGSVHIVE
jgi:hypothetical protein